MTLQPMTIQQTPPLETAADFRAPTPGKRAPRAVADAGGGLILAVADLAGPPEAVFRALTTDEVERWWRYPGQYHQKDWAADVRVGGPWRVTVVLVDGGEVRAWGEFCALRFPEQIVMTRRFDAHPFLGERETTITYHLEPNPHGTRVTVRDEGFVGRAEAAYGNAEIWEQVLGWLDGYLRDGSVVERRRMATVSPGHHTAVVAARADEDRIRRFYGEVLGCTVRVTTEDVDRFQLEDLHFCFVYQSTALDERDFRKAIYLELKTDDPEEMTRRILAFGVTTLDVPDAHLYFQAPGGQVFRLVGVDEDLSRYEGSPSSSPGSSASAS